MWLLRALRFVLVLAVWLACLALLLATVILVPLVLAGFG